jgi:type IV pilus assembly protein PilE
MPMLRSRKLTATDISIMAVVVAIVAIVSVLAVRAYSQYFLRARIIDAVTSLADMRTKMERYFQANLTYNKSDGPPCAGAGSSVAPLPTDRNFTFTCPTLSATQFTVVATGTESMQGFQYSIDQNNNRFTTSLPAGWAGVGSACWVIRQDGSC